MSTSTQTQATQETYQFEINAGPEEQFSISGRTKAVERAKEISADRPRPVRVEREDGKVKMEFRSGSIVRYRRRTR